MSRGPIRVIVPNFIEIGQTVKEISISPRWRPSAILDLLDACSDHAQTVLVGLNRYKSLVAIGAVVSIIWRF